MAKRPADWVKYPVFGVVAALRCLFLNMISSTLLGRAYQTIGYYVFARFCLPRRRLAPPVRKHGAAPDGADRPGADATWGGFGSSSAIARLMPLKVKPSSPKVVDRPAKALSYNDVEILRTLADKFHYTAIWCRYAETTGLSRSWSIAGCVMKAMGVIETRINEKNVLHWFVSARAKALLADVLNNREQKKSA